MMQFQRLIKAWRASESLHKINSRATDYDLELAEAALGFPLPDSLRELYQFSDGIYLLEGNLQIHPLQETNGVDGLSTASSANLRKWGWQVPIEVLAFGNNGGDEQPGIWLPEVQGSAFKHPILEIGEIFEPQSMAILATDLESFLVGWTAYYSMLCEADSSALDMLGVPDTLRFKSDDLDGEVFARLRQWADPHLPDPYPDPYRKPYDAEGLRKFFASK